VDVAQVRHVRERVCLLFLRQGARRPIGEPRRLVEFSADDGTYEVVIRDAVAEPADTGGDLCVEDVRGNASRQLDEDFDVLAGGMEYLGQPGVREEAKERFEAQTVNKWIDEDCL